MKTFLNLMYVLSFICLLAILGIRNSEIDRWIYQQEMARQIMLSEEASMEMDMPIEIGRVSL